MLSEAVSINANAVHESGSIERLEALMLSEAVSINANAVPQEWQH